MKKNKFPEKWACKGGEGFAFLLNMYPDFFKNERELTGEFSLTTYSLGDRGRLSGSSSVSGNTLVTVKELREHLVSNYRIDIKCSLLGGVELSKFQTKYQIHTRNGDRPDFYFTTTFYNFKDGYFESYYSNSHLYPVVGLRDFKRMYFLSKEYTKKANEKTAIDFCDTVVIPAQMLRDGFAEMTPEQRHDFSSLVDPFTGVCKKSDLQRCYNEICKDWKTKLAKEFPFLNNYVVFEDSNADDKTYSAAGVSNALLSKRIGGPWAHIGIILHKDYKWKIQEPDSAGYICLTAEYKK